MQVINFHIVIDEIAVTGEGERLKERGRVLKFS